MSYIYFDSVLTDEDKLISFSWIWSIWIRCCFKTSRTCLASIGHSGNVDNDDDDGVHMVGILTQGWELVHSRNHSGRALDLHSDDNVHHHDDDDGGGVEPRCQQLQLQQLRKICWSILMRPSCRFEFSSQLLCFSCDWFLSWWWWCWNLLNNWMSI